MSDSGVLFEDYIPTDKWSLTDWYLSKVVYLDRLFSRVARAQLSGGQDVRVMIDFVSAVRSYHAGASNNFEKFLKDDYDKFVGLFPTGTKSLSYELCFDLYDFVNRFHWASGLTNLSESRALGSFAKARSNLGLSHKEGEGRG